MKRLIHTLPNKQKVVFDQGRFDSWCVYLIDSRGRSFAPTDTVYFTELAQIAKQYPEQKLYSDFVKIYDKTTKEINNQVIELIKQLAKTYRDSHQQTIEKWFTVLYAGMIAEENKENAILKKRIKRLGMHQLLMEHMDAKKAAVFSRGKPAKKLNLLMKTKGF